MSMFLIKKKCPECLALKIKYLSLHRLKGNVVR